MRADLGQPRLQAGQVGLVLHDLLQQQPAFLAEVDGALPIAKGVVALFRQVQLLAQRRQLLVQERQRVLGFGGAPANVLLHELARDSVDDVRGELGVRPFQAGADDAGLQGGLAHGERALDTFHRADGRCAHQLELRPVAPYQLVHADAHRAQRGGACGLLANPALQHRLAFGIPQGVGVRAVGDQREHLAVVLLRRVEQRHRDGFRAPRVLRQAEQLRGRRQAAVARRQPRADHREVARPGRDIQMQLAHRLLHHQARADQLDLGRRGGVGIEDRRQRLQRCALVGIGVAALAFLHLDHGVGAIDRFLQQCIERAEHQRQQGDGRDHAPVVDQRHQVVRQPKLGRAGDIGVLGIE